VSWYVSLICPLSPLARSLIIAAVVLVSLVHIRLMFMVERWIGMAPGQLSRRMVLSLLIGAHIDAGLVAGFGVFHALAEGRCGSAAPGMLIRLLLPLGAAAAMVLFAWRLLVPHLRHGAGESPRQ
jgi:hypothetical protein